MAEVRLGGAYINFLAKNAQFLRGVQTNITALRKQRAAIRAMQEQVSRLRTAALRAGQAFTLLGAVSLVSGIRTIAQFEQSMANVRAVTGASADEMERLNERVRRLGESTRYTATQVADVGLFLGRTGFSTDQIERALQPVLLLAQATNIIPARAADLATNIVNAFGAEVSQLNRYVDILAKTTSEANTDMEQLGQALLYAAPIARQVGVDITTLNAAIGVLGDRGIQATVAGTGIRQFMADLIRLTPTAEQTLADLGLSADDVNIAVHGLTGVLRNFTQAGITTEQVYSIFEVRSASVFDTLLKNIDAVDELRVKLQASGGAAQRMANIMDNTLSAAALRLVSAYEGFKLQLDQTTGLSSRLSRFFDSLAENIRAVGLRMDRVVEVGQRMATYLGVTLVNVLVTGPLLKGIFLLIRALSSVAGAVAIVTIAFRTLLRATGLFLLNEALLFTIDTLLHIRQQVRDLGQDFSQYLAAHAKVWVAEWTAGLDASYEEVARWARLVIAGPFDVLFSAIGDLATSLNAALTGQRLAPEGFFTQQALNRLVKNYRSVVRTNLSEEYERIRQEVLDSLGFNLEDYKLTTTLQVDTVEALRASLDKLLDRLASYPKLAADAAEGLLDLEDTLRKLRDELDKLKDAQDGDTTSKKKNKAAADELADSIGRIVGPIGNYNLEAEKATAHTEAWTRRIEVLERVGTLVPRQTYQLTEFGRQLRTSISGGLEGVVSAIIGPGSITDAFTQMLRSIALTVVRLRVLEPLLDNIFSRGNAPSWFERAGGDAGFDLLQNLRRLGPVGRETPALPRLGEVQQGFSSELIRSAREGFGAAATAGATASSALGIMSVSARGVTTNLSGMSIALNAVVANLNALALSAANAATAQGLNVARRTAQVVFLDTNFGNSLLNEAAARPASRVNPDNYNIKLADTINVGEATVEEFRTYANEELLPQMQNIAEVVVNERERDRRTRR